MKRITIESLYDFSEITLNISSNSLDSLEARLRSEVQRFFPDIEIEELKVTSENPDLQAVTITLRYRVRQFSIQDEFTIVLQQ